MRSFLGFPEIEVRTSLALAVVVAGVALVNQVEQPFARSLVSCDTPLNATAGALFTGSLQCGDRLHVIGRGAVISGNGQTLELLCKMITTFVVSFLADTVGRKVAAIYGTTCALLSVVLFVIASKVHAAAPVLFVLAQGLQGCNGVDVIARTMAGDLMLAAEDSVACAKRGQLVTAILTLMVFLLCMAVLSAEITDFTFIWVAIICVMSLALAMIAAVMPETIQADKKASAAGKSLASIIVDEGASYVTLLRENTYVRFTAFELIFGGISDAVSSIFSPFLMARFGVSQLQAVLWLLPTWITSLVFIPLVPALAKKFGNRKMYAVGLYYHFSATVLLTPVVHHQIFGIPAPIFFMLIMAPFAGGSAIVEAFRARLVGQDNLSKFAVITTVISMAVGSLTSFIYSRLFFAEATTWLGQIAPFVMALVFRVLSYCVFFFGHGHIVLAECEKMTEEARREEEAKAEKKAD